MTPLAISTAFFLIGFGASGTLGTTCQYCKHIDNLYDSCSPDKKFRQNFTSEACDLEEGEIPVCEYRTVHACSANINGLPGNYIQRYHVNGCANQSYLDPEKQTSCFWSRYRVGRDIRVKDRDALYVIAPSIITRFCYCRGADCNRGKVCTCGPTCNDFSTRECVDPDDCDCLKQKAKCGEDPYQLVTSTINGTSFARLRAGESLAGRARVLSRFVVAVLVAVRGIMVAE